jgi:hypothetical protein
MAKLVEMDERVSIFAQMEENVGSVILIDKFSVAPEDFDSFLKGWATEAEKFKEQPGFISTQLHKGIGENLSLHNYTRVLVRAVHSLTMQFGNLLHTSRRRLVSLGTQMTECRHVLPAR